MSTKEILKMDSPGKKVFTIGNYAIARGAIESGVDVVAGYPGTPSTECLEILGEVSHELGFYAELSVNEKVATEVASGASIAGMRSLVTTKHVGMNVAADQLNVVNLTGVNGGMVIYCADDMGAWISQNEQDTRVFAKFLHMPCLSAMDPQDSKELTKYAFELSEKYSLPVILRTTQRVSHASGIVEFGPITKRSTTPKFEKKFDRYYLDSVFAQALHDDLHKKLVRIEVEEASDNKFDVIKKHGSDMAVLADGPSYLYVLEALKYLGFEDKVSVFRITFTNPLPNKKIAQFLEGIEKLAVIEEIEPFLEDEVKRVIYDQGITPPSVLIGRKSSDIPWMNELNVDIVGNALARLVGAKYHTPNEEYAGIVDKARSLAPPRTLNFCAGCPHLGASYALKETLLKEGKAKDAVVTGDIGCYGLAPFSGPQIMDTSFCMGSGLTMAHGFKKALQDKPVIGTIGDSTFFHAGMTGLINTIWNQTPILILIMDNRITAMTGHQSHAGVDFRIDGTVTRAINEEDIAKAAGYEFVEVVDPYDIKTTKDTFSKALKYMEESGRPAVVITRRECALLAVRKVKKLQLYAVDKSKCIGCKICATRLGCQAISWNPEEKKAEIDPALCVGCAVCVEVCPPKVAAIVQVQ